MALNHLTTRAFPPFYQDYASKLLEFFQCWVDWMNQDGNSAFVIDHLSTEHDIDESVEAYKIHLKQMLLSDFPDDIASDLKFLLKNVFYLYNSKSSEEAYKFFFKAVYNESVEINYYKDKILKSSDGRFNLPSYITCYNAKTLFSDVTNHIGWMIVGKTSKSYAYITGSATHDFILYKNDELYHKYEDEEIKIKLENDGVLSDDNQIIRYLYIKDEESDKNLFEKQYVCLDKRGNYIQGKNTSTVGTKIILLKYSYINQNAIIVEDQHGTFINNSTFSTVDGKYSTFEDGESFYLLNPETGKIINYNNSYITASDTARVQWNNFRNPSYVVPSSFNWNDSYGLLDSDMVLQDNYKYQNYSYEIKTNVDSIRWKKAVKLLLHPAGFKLFANKTITDETEDGSSFPIMWYNTIINPKNIVDSNLYYVSSSDKKEDAVLKDRNDDNIKVYPIYSHGKDYITISIIKDDTVIKTTTSQDDYSEVLDIITRKEKGESDYIDYSFSALEHRYDTESEDYITVSDRIIDVDKIREYITSNFLVGFEIKYNDGVDSVKSYTEVDDNIQSDDTTTITVRDYLYNNIFLSEEERTKRKITNPSASYFNFIKKFFRIWFYMDNHDEELLNLPKRERNSLNLIGIASLYPYKKQYGDDSTITEKKSGWISFILKMIKLTQTHSETPGRWLYRGEYSESDDFGCYKVEDINHLFNKNSVMLFNDVGALISPYIIDWVNFEYNADIDTENIRGFTLHTNSHLIMQNFDGNYFYPEYDEDYVDEDYFVFATNVHVNDNHKIAQFILKSAYSTYTNFKRIEAVTDSDGNIVEEEYNLLPNTGDYYDVYNNSNDDNDPNNGRYYSLVTEKDSDENLIPLENYVGLTDLSYYAKKSTNEYTTWGLLNKEDYIKTNTGLVKVYDDNCFLKVPEEDIDNSKKYKNYSIYIQIEVPSASTISNILEQESFSSKYYNYAIMGTTSGTSASFLCLSKFKFTGDSEKTTVIKVEVVGDFEFINGEDALIYDKNNGRFGNTYSCKIVKFEKDLLDPNIQEVKSYDFNSRYYSYPEKVVVYSHKPYDFQNRIYIKRVYDKITAVEQKYTWNDSVDLDTKDINTLLINENLIKNDFYDEKYINIDEKYIKIEKEDNDNYYIKSTDLESTYNKNINIYKESSNGNYIKIKSTASEEDSFEYFKTEYDYNEIEKRKAYKEVSVDIIGTNSIRFLNDSEFITYVEIAQSVENNTTSYSESDNGDYLQFQSGYYKFTLTTEYNNEYVIINNIDIDDVVTNNTVMIVSLLNQDDNNVSRIFYKRYVNSASDTEYFCENDDGKYIHDAYVLYDSNIKKYYYNSKTKNYEDYISGNTIYICLCKENGNNEEDVYVIANIDYRNNEQYYKIPYDSIDKQYTLLEEYYSVADSLLGGNYIKCEDEYVFYNTKEEYNDNEGEIVKYCSLDKSYVTNIYTKTYYETSDKEKNSSDTSFYKYKTKKENTSKFYEYYNTTKGQISNYSIRLPRMISKDEVLVFADGLFTENYEIENKKYFENGVEITIPVLTINSITAQDILNGNVTVDETCKKFYDTFANDIVNINLADQIEIKESTSETAIVTYFNKNNLKVGNSKLNLMYFNNNIYTIPEIISSNPYFECEIYIISPANTNRVMEENKSEHSYIKIYSDDFNVTTKGEIGVKYMKISDNEFEEISGADTSTNGNYIKINDALYPFITKQNTEYDENTSSYVYKNYIYVNMEDFRNVEFYGYDQDGNRVKREDKTINRGLYSKETFTDKINTEYDDDDLFSIK